MSASIPKISIIVCTYNRAELLLGCLQALTVQTLDRELYEVVIIDNNSTDNTQEIVHRVIANNVNFRIVSESKQGLSHARNRGWHDAVGEFIAYIDDDAKASPDWTEKILLAFETVKPTPAAVGGRILPWYETDPPDWFVDEFEIRAWGDTSGFLQPPRAQSGFSGSNMAFAKETLTRLSGFSSEYGMVGSQMRMGEEADLFRRLYSDSPWFWYDPEITVSHWVPVRNMKVSYRFIRAYRGGEAYARRLDRRVMSIAYFKACVSLLIFLLISPLKLLEKRDTIKTEFVVIIQALGGRFGYLFARI